MALSNLSKCSEAGVFDEELSQQELLDLIDEESGQIRDFFANIDKIDFTGGFNEISYTWVDPDVKGSLFFKIGGLLKKMAAPPADAVLTVRSWKSCSGNGF